MNVLYIACTADLYGASQSLLNMLSACDTCSCYVVLPKKGPLENSLRSMNIPYKIINYKPNCASPKSLFGYWGRFIYYMFINYFAIRAISHLVKTLDIHIIHTNNSRIQVGYEVAKKLNIKHVWHLREFMDLDFDKKTFKSFENQCEDYNNSNFVICVSNAVKEHFRIKNKNVKVIYDAVDTMRNVKYHKERKEPYFLFCGSLIENKGIFDAIYAFSEVAKDHEVRLCIAGTGNSVMIEKINDIIRQECIQDKVELLGFRSNAKLLMRKALALLMCSKYEAYGRVTTEAMLNDCVVIGRNSGGTTELIEHGKTGFLFNSREELTLLMEKVLSMDTSGIRDRAREKAVNSFTEEVYAEQLKQVYDSLR